MSETNNNTPMRITQLQEAETFDYESYLAAAKAGTGTKKVKGSTLFKNVTDALSVTLNIKNQLGWARGLYTASGNYDPNSTFSNFATKKFNFQSECIINVGFQRQVSVAYWDKETGDFISRTSWTTDTLNIDTSKIFAINIATTYASDLPLAEALSNINIYSLENHFIETVYVQDGWAGATQRPQSYYVHTSDMNFKSGDVLTANAGYELALKNEQGLTTVTWTTTYTMTEDVEGWGVIIRRTDASAEINKDIDGLTLLSYIKEPYKTTNSLFVAKVIDGISLNYILSRVPNNENTPNWKNKKAAFIGDSITYGVNTSQGHIYYQLLNNMIGFSSVYADGVAGSCYSKTSDYGTTIIPIVQRTGNIPSGTDLIVIFAGTNDFGHGTPIGEITDTTDVSFCGAVAKTIIDIVTAFPSSRLVLLTPLHRTGNTYVGEDTPNAQGKVLIDYVNALKSVAEKYSIPIIDLYSIYGLNPIIPIVKTNYITDGLHPNDAGHELLAKRIYPLLEALQKN